MKKKITITVVVILVALLAGRVYLPVWVKGYVNDEIDALAGYTDSMDGIDINLYRGAYAIEGLELFRVKGQRQVPFLKALGIDFSVHWRSLLKGELVGEVVFYSLELNFVETEKSKESSESTDWHESLRNLMPLRINRLAVHGGEVHFRDFLTEPKIDVFLHNLNGFVTNISNVEDKTKALPSELNLTGTSTGGGTLNCSGRLNILKSIPDFDINLRFEGADLRAFNNLLRAYSNIDAAAGTFNLYAEMAAEDGQMTGYVKPLLTGVELTKWRQDKENPLQYAWELLAGLVVELFENQPRDQFATKVPLEGELKGPSAGMIPAIWNIISNAFFDALSRSTDNTIDFSDAKKE